MKNTSSSHSLSPTLIRKHQVLNTVRLERFCTTCLSSGTVHPTYCSTTSTRFTLYRTGFIWITFRFSTLSLEPDLSFLYTRYISFSCSIPTTHSSFSRFTECKSAIVTLLLYLTFSSTNDWLHARPRLLPECRWLVFFGPFYQVGKLDVPNSNHFSNPGREVTSCTIQLCLEVLPSQYYCISQQDIGPNSHQAWSSSFPHTSPGRTLEYLSHILGALPAPPKKSYSLCLTFSSENRVPLGT